MAGEKWREQAATHVAHRVLRGMPFGNLDSVVDTAISSFLARIEKAGVRFSDEIIPLFDDMNAINAKGGFSPAEAYAIHRERLKEHGQDIDPNVRVRIERGSTVAPEIYAEMIAERTRLVRAMDDRLSELDAGDAHDGDLRAENVRWPA